MEAFFLRATQKAVDRPLNRSDRSRLFEGLSVRAPTQKRMQGKKTSSLTGVIPDDESKEDFLFKMVVVGDSGVGKTNIMSKFVRNVFSEDTKTTIGVEFATKRIQVDKKVARVQIWDTAGQERYRAITNSYYRGAHAAVVVYDITNSISFNNVKKWITEIRTNADSNILILLVANKGDLSQMRSVFESDALKIVQDENLCGFIETSAKNGDRIPEVFETLTRKLVEIQEKNSSIIALPAAKIQPIGKSIGNTPQKSSGCCK